MLSPQLRRKVHELWSLFWSSGLSNPLVAIEQITYLLFIRELENLDRDRVKQGKTSIYAPTADEKKVQGKKQKRPGSKPASGFSHVGTTPPNQGPHSVGSDESKLQQCRWSYLTESPNVDVPLLRDVVFPWLRTLEARVGPAQNGNTTISRISGRLSDAY